MSGVTDCGLLNQTVTVYHREENTIRRTVAENCYLEMEQRQQADKLGLWKQTRFLLIMPGECQRVFPGDRVMRGIGPQITREQWKSFLPAAVPGLGEAAYAAPFYVDGKLSHVEAGRKWKI